MTHYAFNDAAPSTPAVRQLLAIADAVTRDASLAVHPSDDMFAFGVNTIGHLPLAAMAYFRAGVSITDSINQIAAWHFGSIDNVSSFLDFAGGYGRSTRFLAEYLPAERITVGEIQSDALEFQAREFGVSTLQSTTDPADLQVPRQFDFVFVASLFTHLPHRTFGAWLSKVWELVAPGGVLVFSVHDEAINDMGVELEDGFAFIPATEVAALSTDDYGANFTTEAYVRRQLDDAIGGEADNAIRLPRALCFMQDVWIVPRRAHSNLPTDYECGPSGAFDSLEVEGRRMRLRGWTADRGCALASHGHSIARVEIYLNGVIVGTADRLSLPRPDVAAHLREDDNPYFRSSGWAATIKTKRPARETDILSVVSICDHDRRFVLDSTYVADMLSRTAGTLRPSLVRRRATSVEHVYRQGGMKAVAFRAGAVAKRNTLTAVDRVLRVRH